MEFLGALMQNEITNGDLKPIKSSKNKLAFSHLFFNDDAILIANASITNVVSIKRTLDLFHQLLGLKVSLEK